MDRVKAFVVLIFAIISSIIAEPPSSYGTPTSSAFSNSGSTFGSSFNRNNNNAGYQSFRSNSLSSSSSFSNSLRGNDPALLAASIPGPKVFRHISLFVAPQEQQQAQTRIIRPQQGNDKHVQIIFVKAPSTSSNQQTEVILPDQPEQKTLVYVLVKKPEANENNVKIRGPRPTKPPAPEVYFIKYKDENQAQLQGARGQQSGSVGGSSFGGVSSFSSSSSGSSNIGVSSLRSGSYSSNYGVPN